MLPSLGRGDRIALADKSSAPVPLGRWLTEDLVLAADDLAWGVARRASAQLGVAETTYRRQLEKVRRSESHGLLQRNPAWSSLQPVIAHLANSLNGGSGENVLEGARQVLLAEVAPLTTGHDAFGAALMGVTVPTYRRWVSKVKALT